MKYRQLFEKTKLGKLEVKNRIAMAAMNTHFNEGDNETSVSRWASKFYEERAKGGVGLIISGHLKAEQTIDPYPVHVGFPVMDNDNRIKEFAEVTDAVHRFGAKIIPELSAGSGRNADDILENSHPVSASDTPLVLNREIKARPLSVEEIHGLTKAYGEAALRCQKAGFDGILIHAHSQLIDQFLSEHWNTRTDEYGGSFENRLRFFKECYEEARARVGEHFPIMVALSLDHGFQGGRGPEGTIELAKALEERFDIDAFYIGDGSYDAMGTLNAHYPEKYTANKTENLVKSIKTPVIVVGKYSNPDDALEAVEKGIHMPVIGRALVADPDWANKVRMNRVDDIRPCLRCMECMDRIIVQHKYCGCAANPMVGHEREGVITPAVRKKSVLVVGGGPAGMQAALTADLRGHEVTLVEKHSELGGRLNEASVPDYKYRIGDYSNWLVRSLEKSNVKVVLNKSVDKAYVDQHNPDAVIIASGGHAIIPPVKGCELGVLSENILRNEVPSGEKVVVIGGGLVGSEVAYHLAKQEKEVTLVEMRPEILLDDSVMNKFDLIKELMELKVDMHVNTRLEEVTNQGVLLVNASGEKQELTADQVIFATGFRRNDDLYQDLSSHIEEVYLVGDGHKVGKIYNAVNDAYMIAREI